MVSIEGRVGKIPSVHGATKVASQVAAFLTQKYMQLYPCCIGGVFCASACCCVQPH